MAGEATNVQSLQEGLVEGYADVDHAMLKQLFMFDGKIEADGVGDPDPGVIDDGEVHVTGKGIESLDEGQKADLEAAVKENGDGKYIMTDFGFKKSGSSEAIVAQSLTQINLTNRSDLLNAVSKLLKDTIEKVKTLIRN